MLAGITLKKKPASWRQFNARTGEPIDAHVYHRGVGGGL